MTDSTHADRDAAARAEVLLWQGVYCVGMAIALTGGALLLRVLDVVSSES